MKFIDIFLSIVYSSAVCTVVTDASTYFNNMHLEFALMKLTPVVQTNVLECGEAL